MALTSATKIPITKNFKHICVIAMCCIVEVGGLSSETYGTKMSKV